VNLTKKLTLNRHVEVFSFIALKFVRSGTLLLQGNMLLSQ